MIRHNLPYKLLALGIALVIWFYANKGYNPNVSKELSGIPLAVRKVEPGLIVTSKPATIKVILEGPREHVDAIAADPEEIQVHVSARGKGEGKHKLPVIVTPPQGYAGLVRGTAVPSEVFITLVREARRVMKAEVDFAGSPPVGFRFGAPSFTPAKVVVRGMPELVNRVSRLTATVQPGELREGIIEGDYLLTARDSNDREIRGIDISPSKVHLRLSLEKVPASRMVFVCPTIVGRPPFPYKVSKIDVQPQTVALNGRPEQLMRISTVGTETLNLSNRTRSFTQRLKIVPPPGTSISNASRVQVSVQIALIQPEVPTTPPKPNNEPQ